MGILSLIIRGALDGPLTSEEYYKLLRTRKISTRYQRESFKKPVEKVTKICRAQWENIS
jgi:hypothetical protein